MTAHDAAVEAGLTAILRATDERDVSGDEEFVQIVVDAVDPIIRADERIANGSQFTYEVGYSHGAAYARVDERKQRDAYWREVSEMLAEAEEVCDGLREVRRQRDAARAEVVRLGEQYEATANVYLDEQERSEALRAEVAALRALVAEGLEAFRLTKEYVNIPDENGFVLLPDVEGWSHWDWTLKARDALLKREEADRG